MSVAVRKARRPLSRGCDSASPAERLASFRTHRQLSGWNLPPLMILAFGARTACQETLSAPSHSRSPPQRPLAVFGPSDRILGVLPIFSDAGCERHCAVPGAGAPTGEGQKRLDWSVEKALSHTEEYDISAGVLFLPQLTARPDSKRETPTLDVTQHSPQRICDPRHTRILPPLPGTRKAEWIACAAQMQCDR